MANSFLVRRALRATSVADAAAPFSRSEPLPPVAAATKLARLRKRIVLLLVHVRVLDAVDEQLRARGELGARGVDARLGQRGHDGRVVADKGRGFQVRLERDRGEGVEELRPGVGVVV